MLSVFSSGQLIRRETFTQNVIKIGRLDSSNLRIDDKDASRMHAVIEVIDEPCEVHIIDLGSSVGTQVNGMKVNKAVLNDGDEIKIGGTRIMVMIGKPKPKKKLYLANPYGFSALEGKMLLPELISALEALGAEVIEPFQETGESVDPDDPDWAFLVAQENLEHVRNCDGVFAVVNGCPPDEGVAFELGFASGMRKKIFLFRDDFRRCSDSKAYPLNLMLFAGLPWPNWREHWFASVDELGSDEKALKGWLDG
jgi:nucleoside 2-deoxyribosyltransferase